MVPVLVRLRAAADQAEVERGQVPVPVGRQDLGQPLPQRPAVLLGQVGHVRRPATTPHTSWNPPGAKGVSQETRPVWPTHRGPPAS